MALQLQPVKPFLPGPNPSETWKRWKSEFENYLFASKYDEESQKRQIALFLHVCGEDLRKMYGLFVLIPVAPATEVTLAQVIQQFDTHFKSYNNEIYAAYKFLDRNQEQDETFETFYTAIKELADECEYTDRDRQLRDKIVHGIRDQPLRERLLRDGTKSLKTVVDQCRAAEVSRTQASEMKHINKAEVETLMRVKELSRPATSHFNNKWQYSSRPQSQQKAPQQFDCRNCGKRHGQRSCPAYGSECRVCHKRNHWAKMCQSKQVNALDNEPDDDLVFLSELSSVDIDGIQEVDKLFRTVTLNNNEITVKLDTGAEVSVIPKSELLKWSRKPEVRKSNTQVKDYSGQQVPVLGYCMLSCKANGMVKEIRFIVVDIPAKAILGAEACQEMGFVKIIGELKNISNNEVNYESELQSILNEYKDVFEGRGRLNREVKITLKDNALPHIAGPRRIPMALHDRVKQKLDEMEKENIITKVDTPTDWVSNIVIVEKEGKLRICLDPRPLNSAIKRPHYPIPNAEQLFAGLQGCDTFTLIDAKEAFWQMPLDENSSFLTTFVTPFGRYRFLVVPYGLINAPEEFQKTMTDIYEKEPRANPYFDDIALGTRGLKDHCQLLRSTLSIARSENLKFNRLKLQLAQDSIAYLGHVITAEGIKPDSRKIEAIVNFPAPKDVPGLQRFLGMVTYLTKFTPNLSQQTHGLRQLLKKDALWLWDANMQRDFESIKRILTQAPVLQHFEQDVETTLSVDASQYGLGVALLQKGKPIAYGSATLTETQQKYAQIEKELLAVQFGLEHFNYYTYGRCVQVETDHKPLLGLSKKPYDSITPRLQRMLLKINRYNSNLVYVPGKDLKTADTLSRAPLPDHMFLEQLETTPSKDILLLVKASPQKWNELEQFTKSDGELQCVIGYVKTGWPKDKAQVSPQAQKYWQYQDELHCVQGLLCRGLRLVVPKAARKQVLETLHVVHRGIVACKVKARAYVFWPGINRDIEMLIQSCDICQRHQRSNAREPLHQRETPERPWQRVSCDIFELQRKTYLLTVDYFSKYIEVQLMHGTSAPSIVNAMKSTFARHGVPEELVSDQGPPFNSEQLKTFYFEWGIKYNPSAPYNPRSNGQVERAIQTFKNTLRKAEEEGKDLHVALLDYRITPSEHLPSPAEMLMGRRLRSFLPVHPKLLAPKFNTKKFKEELKTRQLKQQKYDSHVKILPDLCVGQCVWFKQHMDQPWKKGTVRQVGPQPRTYSIEGSNGKTYIRNRFHLKVDMKAKAEELEERTAEDFYAAGGSLPIQSEAMVHVPDQKPVVKTKSVKRTYVKTVNESCPSHSKKFTKRGRNVTVPIRYRPY